MTPTNGPATATGRKVVAIYGDALLDDVLGIEAEAKDAARGTSVMRRSFADQTPGRWDGTGTIAEPCEDERCVFVGEYHRFSGHTRR